MVETVWRELPERYLGVDIDAHVIMPNHFHGIIMVPSTSSAGAASRAPTLGTIICAFKSISAIRINQLLSRSGVPLWQRNYYERVIRNPKELNDTREYIVNNPANWSNDEEYSIT